MQPEASNATPVQPKKRRTGTVSNKFGVITPASSRYIKQKNPVTSTPVIDKPQVEVLSVSSVSSTSSCENQGESVNVCSQGVLCEMQSESQEAQLSSEPSNSSDIVFLKQAVSDFEESVKVENIENWNSDDIKSQGELSNSSEIVVLRQAVDEFEESVKVVNIDGWNSNDLVHTSDAAKGKASSVNHEEDV